MPQPAIVWASIAGGFAVLDLWAAFNDTPGDTASECIRALGIPKPVMGAILGGAAVVLFQHFTKES